MKTRRYLVWNTILLAVVVCVTVYIGALGGTPTRADKDCIADMDSVGLQTERRLLHPDLRLNFPVIIQPLIDPVIIVNTKVTVTFDNNNASGGEYYRKSRTATIRITDKDFNPNDFYIGVEYSPYYYQDYGPIERKNVAFNPVSGQAHTYKGKLTFKENGRYNLKIEGIDKFTNHPISYAKSFTIDSVAPLILLTFDKEKEDGRFFSDAVKGTLTVTEANFDRKMVNISVKRKPPGQSEFQEISTGSSFKKVSEDTFVQTILFTEDGAYLVDVTCKDPAGNAATPIHQEFFIDRAAPVLDVQFDNIEPVTSNYYNQFRKATIVVDETNFDPGLVDVTQNASQDQGGELIEPPVVSDWQSDGNKHTATIFYDKDGEYSLAVSCRDMAGRLAEPFAEYAFVIDTTPPAFTVTGIEVDEKGQGKIAPFIEYSDPNLLPESVDIQLSGQRRGIIRNIKNMLTGPTGGHVKYHEFPNSPEIDDLYTITVKMADKLNNTVSETIRFSVNRFGSIYEYSDETIALVGTYVKKAPDVVVTETNALMLASNHVTLFKDNRSTTLTEGVDYSFERGGEEGRFYQYSYRVFSANFEDDGLYRLIIGSKDSGGRVSENSSGNGEMDISFIVDNTAPIVSFLNLKEGETYSASEYEVVFSADDNVKLSGVIIYLDGEKAKEWDAHGIEKLISRKEDFSYTVMGDSNDAHHLRVVCADAAGNQAEAEISGFYVTTSRRVKIMNSEQFKIILYVIAALVAMLLVATLILFRQVRKQKRQKSAQMVAPVYPSAPNDNRMAPSYPHGPAIPTYPNDMMPATGTTVGSTVENPYMYRGAGNGTSPETWENAIQADHPITNQLYNQTDIPPYNPGQRGEQASEAYDPSKLNFGETTVLSKPQPNETVKLDEYRD